MTFLHGKALSCTTVCAFFSKSYLKSFTKPSRFAGVVSRDNHSSLEEAYKRRADLSLYQKFDGRKHPTRLANFQFES